MTFEKTDEVNYTAINSGLATKLGVCICFDNMTDKAVLNYWLADDNTNLYSSQYIIENDQYKSWDKLIVSSFMLIINHLNITL